MDTGGVLDSNQYSKKYSVIRRGTFFQHGIKVLHPFEICTSGRSRKTTHLIEFCLELTVNILMPGQHSTVE